MDETNKTLEIMGNLDMFGNLPLEQQIRIARVCRRKALKKNSLLFFEGDPGHFAYILLQGKIQLIRQSAEGKEIVIRSVSAGEFFAEAVLFERSDYPVTAKAVSGVELLELPKTCFDELLEDPQFRKPFIALLMDRMRFLTQRVRYLTLHDIEERFFKYITDHHGQVASVKPGISRKDLAAAIGATPESLSRLLRRLSEAGLVKWTGDEIQINVESVEWPG